MVGESVIRALLDLSFFLPPLPSFGTNTGSERAQYASRSEFITTTAYDQN